MDVRVRLLSPEARLPARAHPGDAGADLHAVEAAVIPPGERRDIGTGLAIAVPPGFAGFVQARSGLAFRNGIMVTNGPGLIDSGYRGELRVSLFNSGSEDFAVEVGDRIAQLVIQRVETPDYVGVDSLDDTPRGGGGFGSTG
ncbi:MAG: dUTP diphosphatase [Thermoleophilia bacterium]